MRIPSDGRSRSANEANCSGGAISGNETAGELCAKSEERLAPGAGCCEPARTVAGARNTRKLDDFIVESYRCILGNRLARECFAMLAMRNKQRQAGWCGSGVWSWRGNSAADGGGEVESDDITQMSLTNISCDGLRTCH